MRQRGITKSGIILIAIIIILCWYNITSVDMGADKKAHTEIVDSLENLPEPMQIGTNGVRNVIINGVETHITYVAQYTISGRVVTTRSYGYRPWSPVNSVLPRDVGMVWGMLSNKEVDSKISWYTTPRHLWFSGKNSWANSIGGRNAIYYHSSNNHLIPSDENVNKLIKRIKKGDYVKIEGYLVMVKIRHWPGFFMMDTSTSRTDTGNGACETIYVTNVTWLKQRQ